ncbi:Hypothetical predicted protein, partial [Pelobates cultripes]
YPPPTPLPSATALRALHSGFQETSRLAASSDSQSSSVSLPAPGTSRVHMRVPGRWIRSHTWPPRRSRLPSDPRAPDRLEEGAPVHWLPPLTQCSGNE